MPDLNGFVKPCSKSVAQRAYNVATIRGAQIPHGIENTMARAGITAVARRLT